VTELEPLQSDATPVTRTTGRRWRTFTRDRLAVAAAVFVVGLAAVAIFAPVIAPYPPDTTVAAPFLGPSAHYLLGTDELGRDILSRLIYGTRVALLVGTLATAIAMVVGVPLGIAAAYYGGTFDAVSMRVMDGLLAFPSLMLALTVVAVLGPGIWYVMLAIGVTSVPVYARLSRATALQTKELLYVDSARAVGASNARILLRVILPETASVLSVQTTLSFAYAVLTEAALSFLGLGIVPPAPSWGSMLATGLQYLTQSPLYSVAAGFAVFITVLSLNLVGDGLRDALDPHNLSRGMY
jgi:peptide/nickel transport system permease protein